MIERDRRDVWWPTATKLDEVKNGPSHLVGHKSSTQVVTPLEGNPCVCADVKSVFRNHEKTTPSILTRADVVRDVVKQVDYTNYARRSVRPGGSECNRDLTPTADTERGI